MDAIYARQSVDKAESISIESQIEICKHETKGNMFRIYQDKGYSGKNMERPQFQEMLAAIRSGEIQRVICYKLDRISRSILDFSSMIEEFQKCNVEFISCTEKFDTSAPMGRAMINICIVFAQLERETIQQRVTDSYLTRSRKGFYMGGPIPYGFKLQPYLLDGIKTSRYIVDVKEAENITLIYSLYARPDFSYHDVLQYLQEHNIFNIRKNNVCFSKSHLADMLKNPIYVKADQSVYLFFLEQGCNIYNSPEDFIGINGCYLYSDKSSHRKTSSLKNQHVVLAPHEGIVASDIWLKARRKCLKTDIISKHSKTVNTWLAGKIKCGKCGYAMTIRKSNSKVQRYFMCSRHLNNKNLCDGVGGLYAFELENTILSLMSERLQASLNLKNSFEDDYSMSPAVNALKINIELCNTEIAKLLSKLADADETLTTYIQSKIRELDNQIKQYQTELTDKKPSLVSSHNYKKIKDTLDNWDSIPITDKLSTVDTFISVIKVTETSIDISWKI